MGVLWSMKACSSLCRRSTMSLKCNFAWSKLQWWKRELSSRQTQSNSRRISISLLTLECVMVHEAPRALELKKLAYSLHGQTVLRHGTEKCSLEPFHSPQLSVHIICRLKFDVYWWTNLFPDMSQTPSVSNLNIHVEIYYATCSLNQWIDYLPIRNMEQQSDHIYYTLLWQVLCFAVI
jgi:hypothetical protein